MSKELEMRLAQAAAKLRKIYTIKDQLNHHSQLIQATKTKITQNLERLQSMKHGLYALEYEHDANEYADGLNAVMIGENARFIRNMSKHFDGLQCHLNVLENEVKFSNDAYFSQFFKNNTLYYVDAIVALRDPLSGEPFEIEALGEPIDDDPYAEAVSNQMNTVIDGVEHKLSQCSIGFAPLQIKVQNLSAKIALVLTGVQKTVKAVGDLDKDIAALQGYFSPANSMS